MQAIDEQIIDIQQRQMRMYNYENFNAKSAIPESVLCLMITKTIRRMGRRMKVIQIRDGNSILETEAIAA